MARFVRGAAPYPHRTTEDSNGEGPSVVDRCGTMHDCASNRGCMRVPARRLLCRTISGVRRTAPVSVWAPELSMACQGGLCPGVCCTKKNRMGILCCSSGAVGRRLVAFCVTTLLVLITPARHGMAGDTVSDHPQLSTATGQAWAYPGPPEGWAPEHRNGA